MKLRVAFFLLAVCVAVVFFSCRRNQPSLIDANRAPETELWYAPLDSSEYEWDVHLYWRGIDFDGVVVGYIWTITDTLEANPLLRWNPSERAIDLQSGTITTRTDEVIGFTAYTNVEGVGLRKNRQAFHIAAIDDNGVIDPTPAVVEFVATVGKLPTVRFHTTVTSWNSVARTWETKTRLYNPAAPPDTVGMFRPFSISYRGFTTNGVVTQYKYTALTSGVVVDGQDQWCSATDPCPSDDPAVNRADPCCPSPDWGSRCDDPHDCPDTLRYFANREDPSLENGFELPSGFFRFVAQCRDGSGAESAVDSRTYAEGVVQIVVNYEPDTEIYGVENLVYLQEGEGPTYTELVDFADDTPDTVPYDSWVRVDYRGWDDSRDSSLCKLDPPPGREEDQCLGYQIQVERTRGATWRTLWNPPGGIQNSQPAVSDSNSKNIGTWDYAIRVRAVDEYGKADGTLINPLTGRKKSEVDIVGNFDPTLDTAAMTNYDGTTASGDTTTFVWNWWRPANYPDTLEFDPEEQINYVKKIFYVDLGATGHDHPKENARFGVVGWRYNVIRTDNFEAEPFFVGQGGWRESVKNVFNQRFEARYRYPQADTGGASVWANPPAFWNTLYEFSIEGRDVAAGESFDEYIILHEQSLDPNPIGQGVRTLLNSTIASESAKRTELRKFWFDLRMER